MHASAITISPATKPIIILTVPLSVLASLEYAEDDCEDVREGKKLRKDCSHTKSFIGTSYEATQLSD